MTDDSFIPVVGPLRLYDRVKHSLRTFLPPSAVRAVQRVSVPLSKLMLTGSAERALFRHMPVARHPEYWRLWREANALWDSGRLEPDGVLIGPRRPGDPPALVADATLAQANLGWSPTCSDIETIISTALAWLRRNHSG